MTAPSLLIAQGRRSLQQRLDRNPPSQRQGDRVWVKDPKVKGGGFWRKLKKGGGLGAIIGAGLAGAAIAAGSSAKPAEEEQQPSEKKPSYGKAALVGAAVVAGVGGTAVLVKGQKLPANTAGRTVKKIVDTVKAAPDNATGFVQLKGFETVLRAGGLKPAAKENGVTTFASEDNDSMFSVAQAGKHFVMFGTVIVPNEVTGSKTHSMAFYVDHQTTQQQLSNKEALRVARVIKTSFDAHVARLPDGTVLTAEAESTDKLGNKRRSIYSKYGFAPLPAKDGEEEPTQLWGVVKNGKVSNIPNPEEFAKRINQKQKTKTPRADMDESQRQGDRVWIKDPRKKGGGYWQKRRRGKNAKKVILTATGLAAAGLAAAALSRRPSEQSSPLTANATTVKAPSRSNPLKTAAKVGVTGLALTGLAIKAREKAIADRTKVKAERSELRASEDIRRAKKHEEWQAQRAKAANPGAETELKAAAIGKPVMQDRTNSEKAQRMIENGIRLSIKAKETQASASRQSPEFATPLTKEQANSVSSVTSKTTKQKDPKMTDEIYNAAEDLKNRRALIELGKQHKARVELESRRAHLNNAIADVKRGN